MITITVRRNAQAPIHQQLKHIQLDPESDTFTSFLQKCDQAFGDSFDSKRIFDSFGLPVTMIHELIDNQNDIFQISEVMIIHIGIIIYRENHLSITKGNLSNHLNAKAE